MQSVEIVEVAPRDGLQNESVTLAFGCPFEGQVAPERVAVILDRCAQAGPDEVALADTIGVGVPAQVRALGARPGRRRRAVSRRDPAALALPQHP